jgi:hypothetical protein
MPQDIKRAKELMNSSNQKKNFAAEQEYMGKQQIKNKVKQGQTGVSLYKETLGQPYPVGKERLDIAKKARLSAKLDSLASVRAMKPSVMKSSIKKPSVKKK